MLPELNRDIAAAQTATGWWAKVAEVRLMIGGSRLQPESLRLHVLVESALTGQEHDRWVTLSNSFAKRASAFRCRVGPPWVQTLEECKAKEYRASLAVHLPALPR